MGTYTYVYVCICLYPFTYICIEARMVLDVWVLSELPDHDLH